MLTLDAVRPDWKIDFRCAFALPQDMPGNILQARLRELGATDLRTRATRDGRIIEVRSYRKQPYPEINECALAAAFASNASKRITQAISRAGRSYAIAKLSKESGVSRTTLYNYLNGDSVPCLSTLVSVVNALGYQLNIAGNDGSVIRENVDAAGVTSVLSSLSRACGMEKVAEVSGLNLNSLHKNLTDLGTIRIKTVTQIMDALGCHLAVRQELAAP